MSCCYNRGSVKKNRSEFNLQVTGEKAVATGFAYGTRIDLGNMKVKHDLL